MSFKNTMGAKFTLRSTFLNTPAPLNHEPFSKPKGLFSGRPLIVSSLFLSPAFLPLSATLAMLFSESLSTILADPTTIHFTPNSTSKVDIGDLDLRANPSWDRVKNTFVWRSPDGKELTVVFIGKVVYSSIGDKGCPYFSLAGSNNVCTIISQSPFRAADMLGSKNIFNDQDMKRARAGFAIRSLNADLSDDASLPKTLMDHSQATLDFFVDMQEHGDVVLNKRTSLLFHEASCQTTSDTSDRLRGARRGSQTVHQTGGRYTILCYPRRKPRSLPAVQWQQIAWGTSCQRAKMYVPYSHIQPHSIWI